MKVEWAPINVPFQRRLQTLAAATQIFILLFGELVCLIIYILCLIKGNYIIQSLCIIYTAFIYYDRHTGDTGGRGAGSQWVRSWSIWKHFGDYFPVDLVKTVDLRPDRHYLFAIFPHGVLSSGSFANFATNYSQWKELYPGIRSKLMTLSMHFYVPFYRELVLSWGLSAASRNSIQTLLSAPTDKNHSANKDGYTSNAVIVVVGGAQEAINSHPNNYQLVLLNRKGFVRMALITGVPLVPVISFGEVDIFDQPANPEGSLMRRYQEFFKKITGIAPIFINGRGVFQYSFGIVPKRRRITTVVGSPIECEKKIKPTSDDINELHEKFCKHLTDLFETHKSKYIENSENIKLIIE